MSTRQVLKQYSSLRYDHVRASGGSKELLVNVMDDRLHLSIQRIGLLDGYPWWNKQRRCDPFWRLYANDRPGGAVVFKDNSIYLHASVAVLVPGWCPFATRIARPGVSHFYIHFEVLNITRPLMEEWFPTPSPIEDATCLRGMANARDALRQGQRSALVCLTKSAVYAALAQVLKNLPPAAAVRWTELVDRSNPLSSAMRFVEDHLRQPISVSDIAGRSNLGEDQFTRLFKRTFGQSPHRYLIDRRLALAGQLLSFGDEPIEDIADRCGFTDRSHLSRLFRRQFGLSPAAYRKARDK